MMPIKQTDLSATWIMPIHVEPTPNHRNDFCPSTYSKDIINISSESTINIVPESLDEERVGRQREVFTSAKLVH
jgi:hypothetical protein